MDAMEKLRKECEAHERFAIEANDILVDLWNRKAFDRLPAVKERVAKLLGKPYGK